MALSTHVTDRYGTNSAFLRNLTNHDDEDGATVNTTRLGLAANDAEADFPTYAGVAYVDTNTAHVALAVVGVIAYLRTYSSKQGSSKAELDGYHERLKNLARIGPRARVTPTTTSVLTPSTPDTSAGVVRPVFDADQFDDVRPSEPRGNPGIV